MALVVACEQLYLISLAEEKKTMFSSVKQL